MYWRHYEKKDKKKKRVIQLCIIAFSIFALIFTAGLAYMEMRPVVVKAVILEAGTPYVDANDFYLIKIKVVDLLLTWLA